MRFWAIWDHLLDALVWLSGLTVALMTLAVGIDVLTRNLGTGGLAWAFDFVEYGMLIVTMGMAAAILRIDRHVEVDLVLMLVPGRISWAMRLLNGVILVGVSAVLAWYASQAAWQSFSQGSTLFRYIRIPEWLPFAAVAFMFFSLAVEGVRRLHRFAIQPAEDAGGRSDAF